MSTFKQELQQLISKYAPKPGCSIRDHNQVYNAIKEPSRPRPSKPSALPS